MVEYYNLSQFSNTEGYIGFMQTMSALTNDLSAILLLVLVFVIPTMILIRKGEDPVRVFHFSSLFTSLLALIFYLGKFIHNSQILYICIMIYVVSASIRWYHKD